MRLFKLKSIIIPFLFLVFIFAGREAFSANQIPFMESEIIVETSPSNPIPNQEITVYISSYSIDLNKSTITWQGEAGVVSSGIGKTSYTFKAPPVNTSASFSISITSPTGESVTKKISIRPADIDIFWESENGYTPPFYKGKSLPITNSSIKLVAIPNVNSSRGFSFVWKKDDKVLNDKSGYDKSYYKFINSSFDLSNQITVVASAVQGDYVAQKSIDVSVYEPEIVFYKKDPAFGVDYNNAIVNNYKVQDDETTIVAEPYHFLMKENQNKFIYDWSINNKSIETPSKKNELSIKPTSRSGYAIIGLNIYHINNMFQDVYKSIKINF